MGNPQLERLVVPGDRLRRDRLGQGAGLGGGGLGVGLGQDDAELVAAQAPDDVRGAHIAQQQLGDVLERRVAGGVAPGVVDPLHAVDVEVEHAAGHAVALGEGDHARELAHEGAPVEHRRQRIPVGQLLQVLDPPARPAQLLAQALGLGHEPVDGGAHLGREFRLRDPHDGGDVDRRLGRRGRLRRLRGRRPVRGIGLAARRHARQCRADAFVSNPHGIPSRKPPPRITQKTAPEKSETSGRPVNGSFTNGGRAASSRPPDGLCAAPDRPPGGSGWLAPPRSGPDNAASPRPGNSKGWASMAEQAPLVGIVMGSQSDWPTMRHAAATLEALGISHEARIISAHRTPQRAEAYASGARERGLKVLVCAAGGAAALAGVFAGLTPLPVLGVPMESAALKGMDSLLSMVQMPAGIPVGTLAIGKPGAINAALLAAAILALADPDIAAALDDWRARQTAKVPKIPRDEAV